MWPFNKPKRDEIELCPVLVRPNYDRLMAYGMRTYECSAAVRDFHIRLLRLEGKAAEADALELKTFGPKE